MLKHREVTCHRKDFNHLNGMLFTGEVQGVSLLHHSKVFSGYYKNYGGKTEQNVTIKQSSSHALVCWGGGEHDWNRRSLSA